MRTALLLTCLALSVPATAATFVWDVNNAMTEAQDGGGTWVDAGSNWYDESTPQQNQPWSNSSGNIAVFGAGTSGASVSVSGPVNAAGLTFRASNSVAYSLGGSGTIALADGSAITIADLASAVASRITVTTALSGNNLTMQKAAGSTQLALITLAGSNALSGTFTLRSADSGGLFVQANSTGVLPSGTLTAVDVGANVSLVLAASGTWAVPFTLQGTGAGGRGAIRFETSSITLTGAITLAANTSITQNTGVNNTVINSNIGESGGARSLTLGTQGTSTGTIALGGNNTFTGGLVIEVTNVRIDSDNALNSATPNLVTFSATTAARSLSLNGHSITVAGLNATATTVSVQNASTTAATLTINATGNNGFAGVLADGAGGGALSVVKNGALSQALSGNNTSTGGLTLNQGDLSINSATALGATASTFTINGGNLRNTSGTAITLTNNNAMVWNADFSASLASALNLGTGNVSLGTAAGATRTITVSTGTLTVGGAISDGATATALTKGGTGLLILGGGSSYSGVTTVTTGNLRITHGGALGSSTGGTTVSSGARLQLDNNITVTGESLATTYLENVGGSNAWTGTIQAQVAAQLTLDVAAGSLLISGNVNASASDGAHTINLQGAGTGEVSGVISNTFGFNKSGAGTWILSGANSYTSATNVNGGVLQVGRNGTGQTGTGVVTVNSTATLSGTGTVLGTSFVLTSGSFLQAGDGTTAANHGTLTFAPAGAATFNLAAGSRVTLDLTSATATDPGFGGNDVGSPGYYLWLQSVSGAGDHDRLVFTATSGTLTFASNLTVLPSGYTPRVGDVFNLLDWSAVLTTNFSGFNVGTNYRTGADDDTSQFDLPDISGSGYTWDVSRFTTLGVIAVVPEPGRAVLILSGLAFALTRRRRTAGKQ